MTTDRHGNTPNFANEFEEEWGQMLSKAKIAYEYKPITYDFVKSGLYSGVGPRTFAPTFWLVNYDRLLYIVEPQTSFLGYKPHLSAVSTVARSLWKKKLRTTMIIGGRPKKLPFVTVTYMEAMPDNILKPEYVENAYKAFGSKPNVFANFPPIAPEAGQEGAIMLGYSGGLEEEDKITHITQEVLCSYGLFGTPWAPDDSLIEQFQGL
jgi:hypothetical protein